MADVDEIISKNPQSDKPPHSIGSPVAAAMESMAPLQDADAAFTAGAPFLGFSEPALFLTLLALHAFGGLTGNRHSLHAQFFGLGFVGGGEETGIGCDHLGSAPELRNVPLQGTRQQGRITGALIDNLVMNHDLIFGFLDLDHLAELRRLPRFALPADFRFRFKDPTHL